MSTTSLGRPRLKRNLPRALLWALLGAAAVTSTAQAAWVFPRPDSSARNKVPGKTVHPLVQNNVRPLGNHLRNVQPLGGTRRPAKTILARRPS